MLPAVLQQPGDRLRCRGAEAAATPGEGGLVVGHEAGTAFDQTQREGGLAGAGPPAQQHPLPDRTAQAQRDAYRAVLQRVFRLAPAGLRPHAFRRGAAHELEQDPELTCEYFFNFMENS